MITNNKVEHEANLFALFLLMPRDLLMEEILKFNGFDLTSDELIKSLCQTFQVSQVALTMRLGLLDKSDKKLIGLQSI